MSTSPWLVALALLAAAAPVAADDFELVSPQRAATVLIAPSEPECVRLAVEDLVADVERITGRKLEVVQRLQDAAHRCVVVGSADGAESAAVLATFSSRMVEEITGKWEAYRVQVVDSKQGPVDGALLLAGSDQRGTMFAIYAFIERYLGVDPLYLWTDRLPAKRDSLLLEDVFIAADEPTFRYRGWFINDEDLLTEWYLDGGERDIDYPFYSRIVSPQVSPRIFETLLRLQYNLVIPASFVDIRNPDEERLIQQAVRRGLFVSQHHIEPLGVSGFGFANYYRDRGEDVPYSFVRHPDKFEHIWRDYAKRWAKYGSNVIWQLGLRGIADRPVWVSDPKAPKTSEERGKLISDAMALQWKIVSEVDSRPNPPATTTLWMEGAGLHQAGHLTFPPGVAVIFADNGPGWELQRDFHEVQRLPQHPYGIYYHQALWGTGPHLVQAVSPQRMLGVFEQAVERGSNHYAIINVSNIREFVLGVDASARFLRNFDDFDPDRFLTRWCRDRFGPAAGPAERCYRRLFDSFVAEDGSRRRLDGEILHTGSRFLKVLSERVKANTPRIIDSPERVEALLGRVEQQRAAVERAGADVELVLGQLDGAGKNLFENNFVAQQKILLGLLRWLESSLRAGLALGTDQVPQAREQLRNALDGMKLVHEGKALASRGQWAHWYRGDRKMNVTRVREITEQLTRQIDARAE